METRLSVPLLPTGVTEALFARSEKMFVLKQDLVVSVNGSTKNSSAILTSLGSISFSPIALLMFTHFINFNTSAVVTLAKEKKLLAQSVS